MNSKKVQVVLVVGVVMLLGVAAIASAQQPITLSLAVADNLDFFEEYLIPEFERRYPHITVEAYRLGWGAEEYMIRYLGGAAPDIFQGGTGMFGLAAEGMMAPMNLHIDRHDMWDFYEQLPPAVQQALMIDGQVYGLPWSFSSDNFTYLANLFAESGLDPDTPPRNWDELLVAGRSVTRFDPSGNMTMQGIHVGNHHNNWAPFLYQAGGTWMNEDFTEVLFGDERGLAAVEFVHSMIHEHNIIDQTRSLPDLAGGGAAMQFRSASIWGDPTATSQFFSQDDVRVALPPTGDGEARGQRITPNTWLVSSASNHQAEAFDFIAMALELEFVVLMGQEAGIIPVWMEAVHHSPWADDPRWVTALEALQYGQLEPITSPHWEYIRRNYIQSQLPLIYEEGHPPSLIQESARQANIWLQEVLSSGN